MLRRLEKLRGLTRHGYDTDPRRERALGRIPVWLDLEDVRWLTRRCICGPDRYPSGQHIEECTRIRWRFDVALDKAGLKARPASPEDTPA